MKNKFVTFIVWGSDREVICEYAFPTQAELRAFLLGVDETCGWMDYNCFNSRKEADEFSKEEE